MILSIQHRRWNCNAPMSFTSAHHDENLMLAKAAWDRQGTAPEVKKHPPYHGETYDGRYRYINHRRHDRGAGYLRAVSADSMSATLNYPMTTVRAESDCDASTGVVQDRRTTMIELTSAPDATVRSLTLQYYYWIAGTDRQSGARMKPQHTAPVVPDPEGNWC
ncbi:MAG: hypothetical protein H6756_10100 [Candidatus Omnitrophica bacterium]|nr:hypothetical protein [Candidatus Omnitrophota bacterium]